MAASTKLTREQRIERARKAGRAAQSPDAAVRRVIASLPKLTLEQIKALRDALPPVAAERSAR